MIETSYADRLFEIINSMSTEEQKKLLEDLNKKQIKKTRNNERKECLITVNYAVKRRAYQDFIQNIGTGGVFIETREKFSIGDEILLTISYTDEARPFKISGKVVHVNSTGVGIRFKMLSQVQGEMINTIISKTTEVKKISNLD